MLLSQDGFSNRIGFYWAVVEKKVTGSVLAQPPLVSEQTLREEVQKNHPQATLVVEIQLMPLSYFA